jgi:hypothetical protein
MKKVLASLLEILILLSSLCVSLVAGTDGSSLGTVLYIDPTLSSAKPGRTFNITVTAKEVMELFLGEFYLCWDSRLLYTDIDKVNPGDVTPYLDNIYIEEVNDTEGWLHVVVGRPVGVKEGLNGTVQIAKITFLVRRSGSCALHLYNTRLKDIDGVDQPHTTKDGYFEYPVDPEERSPTKSSISGQTVTAADPGSPSVLALIVGGWDIDLGYQFLWDTYYMYYMLVYGYGINRDQIMWLYHDPRYEPEPDAIDGEATKENVRGAITGWLNSSSHEVSTVLIYFACHGGGYSTSSSSLEDGRIDESGDEELEHFDGERWFGVDECLQLEFGEYYWDDELEQDLSTLTYRDLIVVFQACVSENKTCFSGGFIDDLTDVDRTIVTASNETGYSYKDLPPDDGFSEFSESFIDALLGWNTTLSELQRIELENKVNADSDGNGHVSILEAFQYALEHDDAHLQGKEDPWYDDDGDGLPTYVNGKDVIDPEIGYAEVYLDWIPGDIDGDFDVDLDDLYSVLICLL